MKKILKRIIPKFLLKYRRRVLLRKHDNKFKNLTLKQTFNKIYKEKLWGGEGR